MDFWGFLAILAVVAIALRLLRRMFKWVDYLILAIMIIVPIFAWVFESLVAGILTFLGTAFATSLLSGVGVKTEIHRFGHKYSLDCKECGYEKLKIIREEGNIVVSCYKV